MKNAGVTVLQTCYEPPKAFRDNSVFRWVLKVVILVQDRVSLDREFQWIGAQTENARSAYLDFILEYFNNGTPVDLSCLLCCCECKSSDR